MSAEIGFGQHESLNCYLLLLDWEKAFDKVTHDSLFNAMERMNEAPVDVELLKPMVDMDPKVLPIYAKNIILYLGGHIGASSPNAFLGDSCSSIPPYVHRTYDDSSIRSFELALGIFDILKLDQLNVMSKARLTNFFTLTPFFSYSFDIISIGMNNYYKNFGWGVKLDFKKQGYLLPYIKFEKSSSIFDYNLTTGFSFHFKEVN